MSRDAILGLLRSTKSTNHSAHNSAPTKRAPEQPLATLLQQFCIALETNHAQVIRCQPKSWPDQLTQLAASRNLYRWIIGDSLSELEQAAKSLSASALVHRFLMPYETQREHLFSVDASLTLAHAGIAENGLLVLTPGPHEPRTLSLIPPVHVVLLHEQQLHASFNSWLATTDWQAGALPPNILFISGPSKTADIQQTLAYGAHGPRELIILLISAETTHPA